MSEKLNEFKSRAMKQIRADNCVAPSLVLEMIGYIEKSENMNKEENRGFIDQVHISVWGNINNIDRLLTWFDTYSDESKKIEISKIREELWDLDNSVIERVGSIIKL